MAQYITRNGESVDYIAAKYYGSTSNLVVETVLAANPGLADYGPLLPSNIEITLPDLPKPAQSDGVHLWD